MRLIRSSEYRSMPWRNGQGTTREITVGPLEGGRFAWRLSAAEVAASGPFSDFAGYDRVIAVVRGAGMRLAVAGRAAVEVTTASEPYAFPGEATTVCTLLDGPIVDFNLMTERSKFRGTVVALRGAGGPIAIRLDGGVAFLYAARGALFLRGPGSLVAEVAEDATLELKGVAGEVTITGSLDSHGLLASIAQR